MSKNILNIYYRETLNTVDSYEEYLSSMNMTLDTQLWKKTLSIDNKRAYQEYLNEYPKGIYRKKAVESIKFINDKKAWEQAKKENTNNSYFKYLENYNNGIYSNEAKKIIDELIRLEKEKILEEKRLKDIEDAKEKAELEKIEKENKSALDKDKEAWEQAKKEDTKEAYRKYLEDYKYGLYSSIAEDLIELKSRWCWQEENFIIYTITLSYWIVAMIALPMGMLAVFDVTSHYSLVLQIPITIIGGVLVGFFWPIFFLVSVYYYFFGSSYIHRGDAATFSVVVFTLIFMILSVVCPSVQGEERKEIEDKERTITHSNFPSENAYES